MINQKSSICCKTNDDFCNMISRKMKEKGISQRDLAKKSALSKSTISRMLQYNSNVFLNEDHIFRIAIALGFNEESYGDLLDLLPQTKIKKMCFKEKSLDFYWEVYIKEE